MVSFHHRWRTSMYMKTFLSTCLLESLQNHCSSSNAYQSIGTIWFEVRACFNKLTPCRKRKKKKIKFLFHSTFSRHRHHHTRQQRGFIQRSTFNGIVLLVIEDHFLADMILYNPFTRARKIVPHPPSSPKSAYVYGFGYGATPQALKIVKLN